MPQHVFSTASRHYAPDTAAIVRSHHDEVRGLGLGFDDPRFDTLFLVMPISWKGTLAQYVGRLHRDHDSKREVIVYDYLDPAVLVLARMAARRATGYRALGYVLE